ncbi:hypothetical protein ACLQ3B_28890 [Micromonospora sp. DT53]|uniref:hypothetical protein n=1 Tax=Micromonospora sp. DT53 TaxID=3393444 RepID=UPI003CE99DF7
MVALLRGRRPGRREGADLTVRGTPGQLVAIGVVLLLVPVARMLPALAALGLLAVFLAALVLYERLARAG